VKGLDTAKNVPEALKQQLGLIDNGQWIIDNCCQLLPLIQAPKILFW
jgi:hypothetical protein